MTMELLHSRDPADEVIGWLRDISKFIQAWFSAPAILYIKKGNIRIEAT